MTEPLSALVDSADSPADALNGAPGGLCGYQSVLLRDPADRRPRRLDIGVVTTRREQRFDREPNLIAFALVHAIEDMHDQAVLFVKSSCARDWHVKIPRQRLHCTASTFTEA